MGIPHHHRDRFPSSELLHGVDIRVGLHKSSGKGMAQIMKPKTFHVCFLHDWIEGAQEVPRIHPVRVSRTVLASLTVPFVPCSTVGSRENLQADDTMMGGRWTSQHQWRNDTPLRLRA